MKYAIRRCVKLDRVTDKLKCMWYCHQTDENGVNLGLYLNTDGKWVNPEVEILDTLYFNSKEHILRLMKGDKNKVKVEFLSGAKCWEVCCTDPGFEKLLDDFPPLSKDGDKFFYPLYFPVGLLIDTLKRKGYSVDLTL